MVHKLNTIVVKFVYSRQLQSSYSVAVFYVNSISTFREPQLTEHKRQITFPQFTAHEYH